MPDPVLLRPAIIELRYKNDTEFQAAVKLYKSTLQYSQAVEQGVNTYLFVVGLATDGTKKDLLLRLSNIKADPGEKRTLIYWHVKGEIKADIRTRINDINAALPLPPPPEPRMGNSVVEKEEFVTDTYSGLPSTEPPLPSNYESGRSLLRQDASGSYVGITINPPVPTVVSRFELSGGISLLLMALTGIGGALLGFRQAWNKAVRQWKSTGTLTP